MLFNSLEYIYFFCVVFILYWSLTKKKVFYQNLFLLIVSYVFYGFWDYRFLSLIFISSLVDFFVAQSIYTTKQKKIKTFLLFTSLFVNLGLLGIFKYFNFFLDSWISLIGLLGYNIKSTSTLYFILPVGISFYTFQTLSYTIDVYNNKLKPCNSFISFATFVSMFPQLVAGPIERATNLLPQIESSRIFSKEKIIKGLNLILWGLFKKIVVADSLAPLVDRIFENPTIYDGGTLFLGLFYFTFQIYCDFSGYSDIAIGTAKCIGFEFKTNFYYPYFSKNIMDFWRKWHISLSSWFRDYVFIPLGGSKVSNKKFIRNILAVFLISGLWHGANWTFVFWGLCHASIYFITKFFPFFYNIPIKIKSIVTPFLTFVSVMFAWVFFRSPNIKFAFNYIRELMVNFNMPLYPVKGLYYILILLFFDFIFRREPQNIYKHLNPTQRKLITMFLIVFTWIHFSSSPKNFIYFQF